MSESQDDCCPSPLLLPQSIIIAGATKSGKTTFTKRLLLSPDTMFKPQPPEEIMFVYTCWQPAYDEIEAHWKNKVTFLQHIPSKAQLESWTSDNKPRLILIDDKQSSLDKSDIADFVCIFCSHRNLSTILLVQNFFYDSKVLRTVALNVQTLVLFKNRRSEQQIKVLATQLSPGNTKFILDAYRKAVNFSNYGYLLVDLDPRSPPEMQFRTNIFPDEITTVFAPEQSA